MSTARVVGISIVMFTLNATVASAAEICGNGIDDDGDGFADEGCWSNAVMGVCPNPISCKTTGDIAPKTGALVYQLPPDIDPKVPFGPALQFKRTYMSLYAPPATNYRTAMGPHWVHNWMSWLDKSGTTVIVHLVTGQDVKFTYSGTFGTYDYYQPQAGYHCKHLRQATTSPNQWELKMLTGEVFKYDWASPVGKLTEQWDTLPTPNKIVISYKSSGADAGQIDTVTDASGHKRLLFGYSSGRVSSVSYQTISGGTPTTRVSWTTLYSNTNPVTVKLAGTTYETNVYTNGYLTSIQDGSSNHILDVSYVSATPGMVANLTTGEGAIGYDYSPPSPACSGGTLLFFNLANTSTCDIDSNCGTGFRCGGKTGTGSTGKCYRAARCMVTTSPSEDLITTVTPLTPCSGACAPTAEYAWDTATLDLKGIRLADENWTSFHRNSDGLVDIMAEGDTDSDASNAGGNKTYFFYDLNFPGRLTERRQLSTINYDLTCDASTTTACKRTRFTWNSSTGLLDSKEEDGFTFTATSMVSFSYTTAYAYDSVGRLTTETGPLPGIDDDIIYTYHSSTDVFKDGYRKEIKRRLNATPTDFMTTVFDDYDYFGNAKSQQDPDLTFTCRTWDTTRNVLTQIREAMNGQTSCATVNAADLVTGMTYDSWLRPTKTTRPLGDCEHQEYDSFGRNTTRKLRDDCVVTNAGDTQAYSYDANGLRNKVEYKNSTDVVTFRHEVTYYDGLQMNARLNPVAPSYSRSMSFSQDGEFDTLTFENGIGKLQWVKDAQNRDTDRRRYTTAALYDNWHFAYPPTSTPNRKSITDSMSKLVTSNFDDLGRKNRILGLDGGTTIYVYDAASRLTSMVEASGLSDQRTHSFTYDYIGRKLTEDYDWGSGSCTFSPITEIQYTYDLSPGTCPTGAVCTNQRGRLAYAKEVLLCDNTQPDLTLDQETYYGYDASGRLINEYIHDDTGRAGNQAYQYDKNGNLTQVTTPTGVTMGYTYGGTGNSDANLVTTLWRNPGGSATNLLTSISWMPFGPPAQYDQSNTVSGGAIRAMLTWNLAYRATQIKHRFTGTGADRTTIDYTEDEKGRYTGKVYSNTMSGVLSNYLQYDWLDRVTCDAATSGTCPSSGTNLKTNVTTYNSSNDRMVFKHQDPSYGDQTYTITQVAGTDRISSFTQSSFPGSTSFGWDGRGDRTFDDDSNASNDRRDYTYEGRRRVRTITGKYKSGLLWKNYVVTNAYDHRDRRIFRNYADPVTGAASQWYYYYDVQDRLIEVKYIYSVTDPSTYTIYQFYWLGNRPVSIFATDFPSGTVGRYFIHADEANRPIEVMDWPATGDASVVWALNPDSFGWDRLVYSAGIYQPLRLNGAVYEESSVAWNTSSLDRPGLLVSGGLMFDPLTEGTLTVAGTWPNEAYSPVFHNPSTSFTMRAPRQMSASTGQGGCGMPREESTVCQTCAKSPSTTEVVLLQQTGGGTPGGGTPYPQGYCCYECKFHRAEIFQINWATCEFGWTLIGGCDCEPIIGNTVCVMRTTGVCVLGGIIILI